MMVIESVGIEPCIMPKEDPTWRFALAANPESEGWLITLRTADGAVGVGYASSTAHMGAGHQALGGAIHELADVVKGHDPFNIEELYAAMDHAMRGNSQ